MPQEHNQSSNWVQDVNGDSMVGMGDVDFTKFLDLDTGFEQYQQTADHNGHSALDTPMGRLAFGDPALHGDSPMLQNLGMSMMGGNHMHNAYAEMSRDSQAQLQTYQHLQMYQQMSQHPHYRVPPTPVSAEMQAAKYQGSVEHAGQLIFDRAQASFTPLVSPAQTPLENAFCMPEYVTADDFFSPLTSPAIEAQPPFASSTATASPIDLNSDSPNANATAGQATRKQRRKPTSQQPSRNTSRSVRQSPAMKPQTKRRQFSVNSMPLGKIETVLESLAQDGTQPISARTTALASSEDSVSPEPLSELLMRPPPVPIGSSRSPAHALSAKSKDENLPATPAMLMRIPGKQAGDKDTFVTTAQSSDVMEDIVLPDAAAPTHVRTLPNSSSLVIASEDQNTPTVPAKTAKLSAESTPHSSSSRGHNNSTDSLDRLKRPDTRMGNRAGKKRPSVPSAAISPALRPKISPSISPLVPATAAGMPHISPETSALYLASKSNYQNILDGTHLPGVSYPETLAENLSSKRTSHKIAEQGRRNRINLALKEIESLLPPSITAASNKGKPGVSSKDTEDASPDKSSASNQGASKASTVEMAIVYIKSLQAELQDTKQRLQAAEKAISSGADSSSDGAPDSQAASE